MHIQIHMNIANNDIMLHYLAFHLLSNYFIGVAVIVSFEIQKSHF